MKLCFYFKGKAKNLPEILRLPETIRMFENAKSTYLASLERFNRAETEEEIDAAIYDLNAALIRYNSIIKQTKKDYLKRLFRWCAKWQLIKLLHWQA